MNLGLKAGLHRRIVVLATALAVGAMMAGCGGSGGARLGDVADSPDADAGQSVAASAEISEQFTKIKAGLRDAGYLVNTKGKLHNAEGLQNSATFGGRVSDYQFTVAQFDTAENAEGFIDRTDEAVTDASYNPDGRISKQIDNVVIFGVDEKVLNWEKDADPTTDLELGQIEKSIE